MRKSDDLTTFIVPKLEKIQNLNLLEPQEPHQACSGRPLPLPFFTNLRVSPYLDTLEMEALRPFETSGVAHPRPRRQAARVLKLLEEPRVISVFRRCVHAVVALLRCYSAWIRSYYRRFEADYWSFKDYR